MSATMYHRDDDISSMSDLKRTTTVGGLQISPEVFEKLFLSPKNVVAGSLRDTFGVPTPLAIVGFVVALTPLSCDLMMWRGAGGLGAASVPAFYFFGGGLLMIAGFGEFLLGNTFPFTVFMSYGAWFLTYGATLQPFYNATGAFAQPGMPASSGASSPEFYASFGFLTLFMGVLSFLFFLCSLRTNAVFVVVFIAATMGFSFITGGVFQFAEGNVAFGTLLVKGCGGSFFVACMAGWYLLAAILFQILDLPFGLPVFDLSNIIKGHSDIQKRKQIA